MKHIYFSLFSIIYCTIQIVFSADEFDTAPDIVFPDEEIPLPEKYPPCTTKNKEPGDCKPYTMCQTVSGKLDKLVECDIDAEKKGVCCSAPEEIPERRRKGGSPGHLKLLTPTYNNVHLPLERRSSSAAPSILHKKMLKDAQTAAQDKILDEEENLARVIEEGHVSVIKIPLGITHSYYIVQRNRILDIMRNRNQIQEKSPAGWVDKFHKIPKHMVAALDRTLKIAEMDLRVTAEVVKKMREKKGRSISGAGTNLSDFSVVGLEFRSGFTGIGDCREEKVVCNEKTSRRRYDGRCNNLENPTWGSMGSTYQRFLDSAYEDDFNSLRVQHDGEELPSPRLVSLMYSEEPSQELEDTEHTLMLAQFGQFLTHDLTSTPTSSTNGVQCCTKTGRIQARENSHRNCISIDVGKNDAFYKGFGQRCLHMVRSAPAVRPDCKLGPREQFNIATSYIDASQIYGSDQQTARGLRLGKGGRLRTSSTTIEKRVNNSEGFLPPEDTQCENVPPRCTFDAGDERVNENIQLAVLHTVFLREHNRLAKALEKLNPHWNEDTVFHEARRIVIAELQHITFNEFLPIVIGADYLNHHNMLPQTGGEYTNLYLDTVDATTMNVFAATAFRFGHTLIPYDVSLADKDGRLVNYVNLKRTFFNPAGLYRHFDRFLSGLVKQHGRRFDPHLVPALTNQLFENEQGWGMDLFAINIQRGRDHGLPDYSKWVTLCGGENISSNWDVMKKFMRPEAVDTLRGIYPVPQEIDLYAGALGELPEGDALVGRTFACLIGNMFIRLRRGDRLFYEEKSGGFTKAQLNELRKVSLARILCDNSKGITKLQPLVMRETKDSNKEVSCTSRSIPKLDLTRWKHKAT